MWKDVFMSEQGSEQPIASSPATGGLLRVAIVGSGPSGFYAADALLKSNHDVRVSIFERLPVPFGLVRFGVAPDHAKIRNVVNVYKKTADDPRVTYWGNVEIGRDLTLAELREHFDAVILGYGSSSDRRLGIPGEDLARSYTATAFCSWYNGHPDFRDADFDLNHEVAVVIGQGNVAMDVCRVLTTPVATLAKTDMASHAVEALSKSRVRDVHCIGRRGPVQSAFTPKEIAELGEIEGCDLILDPTDLELAEADAKELQLPESAAAQRNFETLKRFAETPAKGSARRIHLHFCKSPIELLGDAGVEGVKLERNALEGEPGARKSRGTGVTGTLPCGMVFRSVGYRGLPLPGAPFDEKRAVVPNDGGRVEKGLYAVGWIKRGPSGLIGTNKKVSEATVQKLIEDAASLKRAVADESALSQ